MNRKIYYLVIHEGCPGCHKGGIHHIAETKKEAMNAWADAALEWINSAENTELSLEQKLELIKESDELEYDSDEDDPKVDLVDFSSSYVLIEYQN